MNPYPYLKECDIYVQPSRTEGYCITLSEAKTFSRPIVTTNFAGAFEQIENERTGLITEVDPIKLYESIKKLIEDGKLRNNFSIELMDANKTDIPDDGIDKIIAKFDI
ncbi:glycosyltransferase [uncultured Trichococcus sp.]|uniref:glycosyltransferase n=1 Tax=uncultured Trichococcus sp. TaxID=189665 RepID=UPI0037484E83